MKKKVRSCGTFDNRHQVMWDNFAYISMQFLANKNFLMETRLCNIFKSANAMISSTLVSNKKNKPFSLIYFEKTFPKNLMKWDKIYLPPQKVLCNTYLPCFLYKILNNVLNLIRSSIHLN